MANTLGAPPFFVFTSALETQSILITQARPELVSGKSNSVSGNYTCRVGLVQTQLRCKTRGGNVNPPASSQPPPPWYAVVQCSNPPPHSSSPVSLPLHPLSLLFLLETRLQQPPSVWEDKKSPAEKGETSFNTAPCCPRTGRTGSVGGGGCGMKGGDCSLTPRSLHPNTNLFMKCFMNTYITCCS